jgi:hypothetical protein
MKYWTAVLASLFIEDFPQIWNLLFSPDLLKLYGLQRHGKTNAAISVEKLSDSVTPWT